MPDIVVLRTYTSETEARFAATVLEANGIPAQVMADNAGGTLPSIALLFPIRLLVRAADETLARGILDTSVDDDEASNDEASDDDNSDEERTGDGWADDDEASG
ncbi:MAG: DUF2007 domain-containing protein [Gemmatimonadaceae bacterium]|nr:DUF2007 domain-containing protein [Gemmatimonadaceae bacterium]